MADHDTHDHTGVPGVGTSSTTVATDAIFDAAGDLVQGTGANTSAKLSAGTSGKVLTSNGAAAALTWETPSAGSALTVKDEGSNLDTAVTSIDFVGSGVVATNTSHAVTVTIAGGGGGLAQSFVGYNTVGGTWTTVTAGRQYTKKVTLGATSNFQSIDVYVRASTDNFVPVYAGLLTDNSNVPNLLIAAASTPPLLLSTAASGGPWAGHWLSIPIGANVAAGDYWLAVAFPSAAYFDIANDGSGSDVYWGLTGAYMSGSHSSLTKTTSAFKYSIRASILT